jgi:hypothetical protein
MLRLISLVFVKGDHIAGVGEPAGEDLGFLAYSTVAW